MQGAVGAEGESGAEGVGGLGRAGGDGEDVGDGERGGGLGVAFTQAEGFFDGGLVEGVEGLFEAGEGEGRGRDAWLEPGGGGLVGWRRGGRGAGRTA